MIYAFFIGHWLLCVMFQSLFQHRYAAHRMYTMKPRVERGLHLLTYLVQGASYLSPRGYAILHRQHHAFSDTERDPHSPRSCTTASTRSWRLRRSAERRWPRWRGGCCERSAMSWSERAVCVSM